MNPRFLLVLAVICLLVLASPAARAWIPGDATGVDGVDVSDIQCIVLTVLKPQPPACLKEPESADVNCDDAIDVVDVQLAILIVLKWPKNGLPPSVDKNGDYIPDACQWGVPVCGDLVCEMGVETCSSCYVDCGTCPGAECGNEVTEPPYEECDDGPDGGQCCTNECKKKSCPCLCGDGIKECWEQCDDGNTLNGDGCTGSCELEYPYLFDVCGNGVLEWGNDEECDDGNLENGDGCDEWCHIENPPCCAPSPCCCDGVKDAGEECDDGNDWSGDGCSGCHLECGVPVFSGVINSNTPVNAGDKLTVFACKVALPDPVDVPEEQELCPGVKQYEGPLTFPFAYKCYVGKSGNVFPVVAIDKGGDGVLDVGQSYSPTPISLAECQITTGIDFVIEEALSSGTISGKVAYGFAPAAQDKLTVMVSPTPPGPGMKPVATVSKQPVPSTAWGYEIWGAPGGQYYVAAILDVGGNNSGMPPGPEDYKGAWPTSAAPETVSVTVGETTGNIDFQLSK